MIVWRYVAGVAALFAAAHAGLWVTGAEPAAQIAFGAVSVPCLAAVIREALATTPTG